MILETTTIWNDLYFARAEVTLAVMSLILLVMGVFTSRHSFQVVSSFGIMALVAVLLMTWQQDNMGQSLTLFNGMLVFDRFGVFMKSLVILGGLAAIVMGYKDLGKHVIGKFEYVILILLAVLGMSIMISANNMLSLYVGLELQSLSLYILASFNRNSLNSSEAGLKYFILGALSSGLLLFGISLVYGYTGTTSFQLIADTILEMQGGVPSMALIVGLVFILTGLAFKISAVPFHMWTPDVYQGSPASVTAFFAMAPKMAAMALLARLLFSAFGEMQTDWVQIIYVLSLASMVLGAFAGLVQSNIYRLLAYSSIGHMGYALIGFIAGGLDGLTATLIYLSLYLVMTAGTFALILSVRDKNNIAVTRLNDLAGLSKSAPMTAYGLAIMMFSMAGIPPLAGFFGKLFIFKAAVASGYYVLAVAGILASVVAAYYYLKLIKILFFDQPAATQSRAVIDSQGLQWIYGASVIFVLGYIIYPDYLVYEATQAALSF